MKNDERKKEFFRWIFLGELLLFVTFPVFTQQLYKNEWIDSCAEYGHEWCRKNSHRWSLFQKRVSAQCLLEFVRKVGVSYRQSFLSITPFSWIELELFVLYRKYKKNSNIDNIGFYHKNWYLSKRIRPIKENEWWSDITIGSNDHITTSDKVKRDDWPDSRRTILGNYYVAATKYTKKNIS